MRGYLSLPSLDIVAFSKFSYQTAESIPQSDRNGEVLKSITHLGHVEALKVLLMDGRLDPTIDNNGYLERAVLCEENGTLDVYLQDPRVTVPIMNHLIGYSAKTKKPRALKRLLEDPRVDPSYNCKYAVWAAVSAGYWDILSCLLCDSRTVLDFATELRLETSARETGSRIFIGTTVAAIVEVAALLEIVVVEVAFKTLLVVATVLEVEVVEVVEVVVV
ncbi:hypothetical protein BCR33DRAFT_539833 [Rhizoclosmatium globosum]|uniref:Ankyrin n=1 Tax=Rhizoclosmatium globosum TaxID=329046 RepID=A0A1Y2BC61_9FUNG|nr:hypothetical protein BCR33DRAFT_539833 [Rhizoclosmatium globosum]|eukprot:ORY32067.1 hypothetical protein BCR33DRAFT_539833 [Rhizoclosmatium globosum]